MNQEHKRHFLSMCEEIDIPSHNNAMVAADYITRAIKRFSLSLAEIEVILRKLNSRVYLIGFPLSFYNKGDHKFVSRFPFQEENLNFALWIEMNGSDSLEKILEEQGWTDDDVDRSLEKTGFLMV